MTCRKFVSMNLPLYSQRTLSVGGLLSTLHTSSAVCSSSTRSGLSGPTLTSGKSEIYHNRLIRVCLKLPSNNF